MLCRSLDGASSGCNGDFRLSMFGSAPVCFSRSMARWPDSLFRAKYTCPCGVLQVRKTPRRTASRSPRRISPETPLGSCLGLIPRCNVISDRNSSSSMAWTPCRLWCNSPSPRNMALSSAISWISSSNEPSNEAGVGMYWVSRGKNPLNGIVFNTPAHEDWRRSRSGPGCRGTPVAGCRWGRCGVWRR